MADKQAGSAKLAKRLGKRIADRRKRLAWTQDQLAEHAHVDAETISRFERGVNLPSLPTLERLATALNVEISELLTKNAPVQLDDVGVATTLLAGLDVTDRAFVISEVLRWSEHLRRR